MLRCSVACLGVVLHVECYVKSVLADERLARSMGGGDFRSRPQKGVTIL